MQSCSRAFEESVREIEGLSDFLPFQLPDWLRAEMLRNYLEDTSDDEMVDSSMGPAVPARGAWRGEWGTATINGQPVFVFTTYYLTDAVCFAADWGLGVTFLEPSVRYDNEFFLAYFFQHGRHRADADVTEAAVKLSLASVAREYSLVRLAGGRRRRGERTLN